MKQPPVFRVGADEIHAAVEQISWVDPAAPGGRRFGNRVTVAGVSIEMTEAEYEQWCNDMAEDATWD